MRWTPGADREPVPGSFFSIQSSQKLIVGTSEFFLQDVSMITGNFLIDGSRDSATLLSVASVHVGQRLNRLRKPCDAEIFSAGFFIAVTPSEQMHTMSHTPIQRYLQNGRVNFQASVEDNCHVPERDSSVANPPRSIVSVEAVEQALWATGEPALRSVQVEIVREIVVLWGLVPTAHLKHLAQVTAEQVAGSRGVANGLEVDCGRCGFRAALKINVDNR